MALTSAEICAELRSVLARIDESFAEDADRHTADKHLTLEQVEDRLSGLVERIEGDRA